MPRIKNAILLLTIAMTLVFADAGSVVAQDVVRGHLVFYDEPPVVPEDEARVVYDSRTGEVWVTIKGNVLVIGLEGAPFLLDNANENTPLGGFEQLDGTRLGQLDFSGLANGTFNLGPILPAINSASVGLFNDTFPNAIFRSGAPGVPEVRSKFNVFVLPAPSCMSLLTFAGLAGVARRRKAH